VVELQGKKMGQSLLLGIVTSGPITSPWRPAGVTERMYHTHCICYYSMDVSGSSDEEDYMHVGKEA
jgi:hypothetical protein